MISVTIVGSSRSSGNLCKSLLRLQIPRNPPQTPDFPENPALLRSLPGIPLNSYSAPYKTPLNSAEFPWISPKFPEFPPPRFHRIPEMSGKSGEERNSRNRPQDFRPLSSQALGFATQERFRRAHLHGVLLFGAFCLPPPGLPSSSCNHLVKLLFTN